MILKSVSPFPVIFCDCKISFSRRFVSSSSSHRKLFSIWQLYTQLSSSIGTGKIHEMANFFHVLVSDNVHKLLICRYLSLLDRAKVPRKDPTTDQGELWYFELTFTGQLDRNKNAKLIWRIWCKVAENKCNRTLISPLCPTCKNENYT